jgi:hypothetical protein
MARSPAYLARELTSAALIGAMFVPGLVIVLVSDRIRALMSSRRCPLRAAAGLCAPAKDARWRW